MSGAWLVDEYTGLITAPLTGSMSAKQLSLEKGKRFFSNYDEAKKYSEKVIAQNGNNSDFKLMRKTQTAAVMFRGPFIIIYLPYIILKTIFNVFTKFLFPICKAPFKKNSRTDSKIVGWIIIFLLIGSISYGGFFCYNKFLKTTGYVTTKVSLNEYATNESDPTGKEIGKISDDVVLKIESIKKTKDSTWLNVYKLEDNKPEKTWILLPEIIKITEDNKYLIYNKNSKTWNNYYEQIDTQNKKILAEIQNEFKDTISSIKVEHSNDKNQKDTLKDTVYILPKKGYLELYQADENDFYYINKTDKDEFLKQVKLAEEKYKETKIEYFSK